MRKNILKSFIIIITLSSAAVVLAEPAIKKPDLDTLKRSISANISLIARFSSQVSDLLKQQEISPTEKLNLKIADLKNKIAVLKNDNEHLTPLLSESSEPDALSITQPQDLTGKDWLGMNEKDKEMYIFSTMGALVKKDVLTMKPSDYYIACLDKLMARNAAYENKSLDDTLILTIYKNEPSAREAISAFRRVGDLELQEIAAA